MEKTYTTWEDYEMFIEFAQNQIQSGLILGVLRGGIIPAIHLSHLTDNPVEIVKFQTRDGNDKEPVALLPFVLDHENFYIVDDIFDTGKTFYEIQRFLIETYKIPKNKIKGIFWHAASDLPENCVAYQTANNWIVYPWEY